MSQFEKQWEASDHIAMPNNVALSLGYIDLTTSYFLDFKNSGVDLWIVITVNTVPSAGTSLAGSINIHTGTDVKDGTALITGRAIPRANMSANARLSNHLILAVPLSSAFALVKDSEYAGSTWRYIGPVITASGDCSTGYVDAWLRVGKPEIPTVQVNTSNI